MRPSYSYTSRILLIDSHSLRRIHFNPIIRKSGKAKRHTAKRQGGSGGSRPPLQELKNNWMKEVEEDIDEALPDDSSNSDAIDPLTPFGIQDMEHVNSSGSDVETIKWLSTPFEVGLQNDSLLGSWAQCLPLPTGAPNSICLTKFTSCHVCQRWLELFHMS